jgi:hypothetical protein
MSDQGPEFEQENDKLGLVLFGLYLLLLALAFIVAFIYLAVL